MAKQNKLFSLIQGGDIHFAPGVKVLSQEEYSTLVSVEELLEKAKQDAEVFRNELEKEAEEIRAKAQEEGFQQGLEQWSGQLANLEKEIDKVHEEVSNKMIPVALKAAKKILGREIETSQEAVVDIVLNNLKQVAHHKNVKIYVNKEDLSVMEKNKEKIKTEFERLESFLIIESEEVKKGGAMIETESGIINAQLENLIGVLEKAFESYIK